MVKQIEGQVEVDPEPAQPRRRIGRRIFAFLAISFAVLGAYVWFSREELADDLISSQLQKAGLEAHYEIESIGAKRQVLRNIVVGDINHPDLTIERVEISLVPRFPFAGIGRIKLIQPRLFGSYLDGKLSFGSLDPFLFDQTSSEPFEFPDMELVLHDGRALLNSDYGPIGFKAQGAGNLRGGFKGILAANAPKLSFDSCQGQGATLFGAVTISSERPGFSGPLRLTSLKCPKQGLALRDTALDLDVRLDRNLSGLEGEARLAGGSIESAGNHIKGLTASSQFSWRKEALTAQYDLAIKGVKTPNISLASLAAEGSIRSQEGLQRIEVQTVLDGSGLRPGSVLDQALANAANASGDIMIGPMLAQIRGVLAGEGQGSTLTANLTLRKTGDVFSLVMPQARLRGTSGDTLLAVSRLQVTSNEAGAPRFSGNFSTGGAGLPQITGRMENRGGTDGALLHLQMAEYEVEGGRLSVPDLLITQGRGGFGLAGSVRASGALPGGSARNLVVPISGNWSSARGLSFWRSCADISFDGLEMANLSLDHRNITLCPSGSGGILSGGGQGMKIAARMDSLDLSGSLGETPVSIRSGPVNMAYPGALVASDVSVMLGVEGAVSRMDIGQLSAAFGDQFSGEFSAVDAQMVAVPLDILDAAGQWTFADGRLDLTSASFRLEDREALDRFEPLIARDAVLSLEGNLITARALMREPDSDHAVTTVDILHDLNSGSGNANLAVDTLTFDKILQPDMLTGMALGVVANTFGTVTGEGRIDWNAQAITSTGHFSTDGLDLAAAFGPVEGISGTITFTDLLGFVTAPDQKLRIASFNPGIEVDEGELIYELHEDYLMVIKGGRWPFLGGALILEPTTTHLGRAEERRYTLTMEGVNAAYFLERIEMGNLSATGLFDGRLPLVFDENGGRIENGVLRSKAPGGNVAYVGELTYEDIAPMANYAFDALKSIDYREMEVLLDGSLTGEIVTKVKFEGIKQGDSASRNFITRQLAKLPIQFNVNIKAPFYKLITAVKAMYDPAYIRDPREIGLIDTQGNAVDISSAAALPAIKPENLTSDEDPIQPPASETTP